MYEIILTKKDIRFLTIEQIERIRYIEDLKWVEKCNKNEDYVRPRNN